MKRLLLLLALGALCFPVSVCAQQPAGVPRTIKEFLKMSDGDTTVCQVRGVVTRIRNANAGNVYIDDGTGELFIYGIVIPDRPGASLRHLDIKTGDTLTFAGRRDVYKGTVEMVSANILAKSNGPDHDTPVKLDREPSFKGKSGKEARKAFAAWVAQKVRYPEGADGEGVVRVKYVIGKNGGVQEVQVEKGLNQALNAEAVRVVSSAPKWKPGILNGNPIRLTYMVDVPFHKPGSE